MTLSNVVLLSMVSLAFLTVHVDALKCFRCNSNDNPDCFNVRPLPRPSSVATSPKLASNLTTVTPSATSTTTPTTVAPTNSSTNSTKQQLKEATPQFLEECGLDNKGREPFCRKMVYTVLNNKHNRVVRECGYERSKTDCYLADNDDHLETVCQCFTDGCNGAKRTSFHGIAAAVAAFGVLLRLLAI